MRRVDYRVPLTLGQQEAWGKLRDLSLAGNYVPGLTAVELTTGQREGVGASRRVQQGQRIVLDETVVEWRDGEGFSLRLHRGDRGPLPPMREAYFDYGIECEDGSVYLHNAMRYSVGLGPLGWLLDVLLLRLVVARSVRDATVAQKVFYETGEKVSAAALAEALARLGPTG